MSNKLLYNPYYYNFIVLRIYFKLLRQFISSNPPSISIYSKTNLRI